MTMGKQWSYNPTDDYKSTRSLLDTLVDITAKGGNLLLNLGPTPDGELPAPGVERLEQIGRWMAVNGEALHGTRPAAPYRTGGAGFTRKSATQAYVLLLEAPKARVVLPWFRPPPGARATVLGSPAPVDWRAQGDGALVDLSPEALETAAAGMPAVIRFLVI